MADLSFQSAEVSSNCSSIRKRLNSVDLNDELSSDGENFPIDDDEEMNEGDEDSDDCNNMHTNSKSNNSSSSSSFASSSNLSASATDQISATTAKGTKKRTAKKNKSKIEIVETRKKSALTKPVYTESGGHIFAVQAGFVGTLLRPGGSLLWKHFKKFDLKKHPVR